MQFGSPMDLDDDAIEVSESEDELVDLVQPLVSRCAYLQRHVRAYVCALDVHVSS